MKFPGEEFLNGKPFMINLLILIVLSSSIARSQNLLSGPQKIVIDGKRNRLLVSNFNTGDIVQIDSAGNQSYFVKGAGLNDGMEILGDTVYGTSGTLYGYDAAVKGYALETGQPVMNVPVPDVVNLSSLVADSSGNLYCSESFGSRIIKVRISDRTSSVFVYSNGLNKPNGLIFEQDRNRLVVLSDRPRPPIQSVSLATAAVTTLTTTTLAGGDGITKDEKGNYYITGYYLSGVYKFDSAFSTSPQMIYSGSGIVYPTYDARDHSLLLTLYNSNDWKRISVTTGIGSCADLPEGIILYQNHPNPFNPTTTIAWHMEHAAYVKLSIYDVLGREVVVLVNEKKEAGTHTVRWNVHQRFAGSARQASGVYFYTLRAGKFLDTKRMLLLE